MDPLPLTQDCDMIEEPGDWLYDDGAIWCLMTIDGRRARIHEFMLHDIARIGERTGGGRAAMSRMRAHFDEIVADGVGDPLPSRQGAAVDFNEQLPWRFWRAMLREDLVDEVVIACVGTRIDKAMLDGPIVVGGLTIEPEAPELRFG